MRDGSTTNFHYEYNLTDHLGNVRVTFRDNDGDGQVTEDDILQQNHYYPFGMQMRGFDLSVQGERNNYTYNGKEYNDDFGTSTSPGLDWLDYGARWYDPALSRFMQVDPLAEATPQMNTYHYVKNNPINRIDPTGMIDQSATSSSTVKDAAAVNRAKAAAGPETDQQKAERGKRVARANGDSYTISSNTQTQKGFDFDPIRMGSEDIIKELVRGLNGLNKWHTISLNNKDAVEFNNGEGTIPLSKSTLRTADIIDFSDADKNFEQGAIGGGWSNGDAEYWHQFFGSITFQVSVNALDKDYKFTDIFYDDNTGMRGNKFQGFITVQGIEPFGNTEQPVNLIRITFNNRDVYQHWLNAVFDIPLNPNP